MIFLTKLRSKIFIFVYLIRLLFSNKKEIYERIFENDHIRKYLNELEWNDIIGKKVYNKQIKKSKK